MAVSVFRNIKKGEKWQDNFQLPELDKMAIEILYDNKLPIGLNRDALFIK